MHRREPMATGSDHSSPEQLEVEESRSSEGLQRLIAAWLQASQSERARFMARFEMVRARLPRNAHPRTGARPYNRQGE